jgi:hypothetical protein
MNDNLRDRLIQAASQEDAFVHYDEVAEILGLSSERLDHSTVMSQELDAISTCEHQHGRPLLTAVVVHKEDLCPGSGFFKMAKRNGKQRPDEDDDAFFIAELTLVRQHWRTGNPVREGSGGGAPTSKANSENSLHPGKRPSLSRASDGKATTEYKTVLKDGGTPARIAGDRYTEKFRVGDNSRLLWWFRCRRGWWHADKSQFSVYLIDAETGRIAKDCMRQDGGGIEVDKDSPLIRRDGEVKGDAVIQNGGEFYLHVYWHNWIEAWSVEVQEKA